VIYSIFHRQCQPLCWGGIKI